MDTDSLDSVICKSGSSANIKFCNRGYGKYEEVLPTPPQKNNFSRMSQDSIQLAH